MSENIQSISQGTYTIGASSAKDSSLLVTQNENSVSILSTPQEFSHDNTLSGNGTVDSPLGIVPGYNETVLFETTAVNGASVCNLSESLKNFERIGVKPTRGWSGTNPGGTGPWNYFDTDQIVGGSTEPFQVICPYIMEYLNWKISQYNTNADCTVLTWSKGFQKNMGNNEFTTASNFTSCVGIQKIIGINRIANN